MKNILLLLSIVEFTFTVKAQCSLPYKSLGEFKNDTTAFIIYNISQRAAYYVGKPIKDVISDLKIPILSYLTIEEIKDNRNTHHYDGIYLYINSYSEITKNIRKHIFKNWITITFETPINIDEFNALRDTDRHKWTAQIEAYLSGQKIRQISN
jgi:hypothetical protein